VSLRRRLLLYTYGPTVGAMKSHNSASQMESERHAVCEERGSAITSPNSPDSTLVILRYSAFFTRSYKSYTLCSVPSFLLCQRCSSLVWKQIAMHIMVCLSPHAYIHTLHTYKRSLNELTMTVGILAQDSTIYSGPELVSCGNSTNNCCASGEQCGSNLLCTDSDGGIYRQYCEAEDWTGCSMLCPREFHPLHAH
jgi:hypothetical protein